MNFRAWLESQKPVVSFDFDGVLHRSVRANTIHPVDFWSWQQWEPNDTIHQQLKREAQGNRIVVVSRRDDIHQEPMWEFIRHYRLPVEEIYTTNNEPKRLILVDIRAIRHYDDDKRLEAELEGTGIEFILVNPND